MSKSDRVKTSGNSAIAATRVRALIDNGAAGDDLDVRDRGGLSSDGGEESREGVHVGWLV
jgi:hypothetical protein